VTARLSLLLIEDDPQDVRLIREALLEIDERGQWQPWRGCVVTSVDCLEDAVACLGQGGYDAVLLNLSLPDSPTLLNTFTTAQAATDAPILALADSEDANLAQHLMRLGAQDVLEKGELECAPLARAIRYAIERQRLANRLRAESYFDQLTGLHNRAGFLAFAERAVQLGAPLLMTLAEIDAPANQDQLLITTADLLRAYFDDAIAIGRLGDSRFGVLTRGLYETEVEAFTENLERELDASRAQIRVASVPYLPECPRTLSELLDEAEQRLARQSVMLTN
jgi:PleD family two-component response regulator